MNLAEHYKEVRARMGMAQSRGVVILPPRRDRLADAAAKIRKKLDTRVEKEEETFESLIDERRQMETRGQPPCKLIIMGVAQHFGLPVYVIKGQRRTNDIIAARHIAFYLCRQLTEMSLPNIGRMCGGKDHTTVLHGANKVERKVRAGDAEVIEAIDKIREAILA